MVDYDWGVYKNDATSSTVHPGFNRVYRVGHDDDFFINNNNYSMMEMRLVY